MIWRCDLIPQYKLYKEEINLAIQNVLNSGTYILNKETLAFEKEFAEYNNVKHAVGVANGTDAIILSLKALNIGVGDEVITTPFTALPTISAIIEVGATPVFCDVCESTFLLDLQKLKRLITTKTKAVIPVHLFGNMVDIDKLKQIVNKKIHIVEDACQAHGSKLNGLKAGSMGDIGAFSFYPTKNLGGYGDGGAIITNNDDLANKIKLLRMYGLKDKDHSVIHGVNSRLDEIQAAILRIKLKYLDKMNENRNILAQRYINELNPNFFSHQKIPNGIYSNYHVFESQFRGDRDKLLNYLQKDGIQTNVYYRPPHHLQESIKKLGYKKGSLPIAEHLSEKVISLPLYPELLYSNQSKVIKSINSYCRTNLSKNG